MALQRVIIIVASLALTTPGCAQTPVQQGDFCDVIGSAEARVGDRFDVETVLVWNEFSGAVVTSSECSNKLFNADFDMSDSDERAFMASLLRTPPRAGVGVQRTRVRIRGSIERLNPNGGVLNITDARRLD